MAEDGKDTWEQRNLRAINCGELVAKLAHKCLRHCQADGRHSGSSQIVYVYSFEIALFFGIRCNLILAF